MSPNAVVTCLFLASGLALAGCAGDPPAPENAPAARTSPSATAPGSAPTPGTTPAPAEESRPGPGAAPAEAAAADPWAAFSATPEGQQYAGTVSGIEQRVAEDGGAVHRITADVNDRAVAAGICEAYRSGMGTGQERVEVVDTADQLLAATAGDPLGCQVEVNTGVGAVPFPEKFSYDEALAAWRSGVPYYDAFCLNYDPVTEAGVAQCEGIENGTVNSVTGEYVGG